MEDMLYYIIDKLLDKIIIERRYYSEFISEEYLSILRKTTNRNKNIEKFNSYEIRFHLFHTIMTAINIQRKNNWHREYCYNDKCEYLDKTLYNYMDRLSYSVYSKPYSEIIELNDNGYTEEMKCVIDATTIIQKILNVKDDEVVVYRMLHDNKDLIYHNNDSDEIIGYKDWTIDCED